MDRIGAVTLTRLLTEVHGVQYQTDPARTGYMKPAEQTLWH